MTANGVNIGAIQLETGKWYVSGTVWVRDDEAFHFYGKEDGESHFCTHYDDHVAAIRAASGLLMELALDKSKFLETRGYRRAQF